jgi:chorismate mutase
MMMDDRLIDIVARMSELTKEVADAEWDQDPRFEALGQELRVLRALHEKGAQYEPKF